MIRLLIIDDEPFIVDGLVAMFEQLELELDVYKAYTAVTALEFIKQTKVDIVISDIRMPEKTGLQLMDELMYYWPSCKVIFLTGYDEFDYVYSAIEKNAQHYILKTEEDDVLIHAVEKCMQSIAEEAQRRSMLEAASLQKEQLDVLLKKDAGEAILRSIVDYEYIAEEAGKPIFSLNLTQPILLITAQFNCAVEELTYSKRMDGIYSIQQLWNEKIVDSIRSESFVAEQQRLVLFTQVDPLAENQLELYPYLKSVMELVQNIFRHWENWGITFVMSKELVMLADLSSEYTTHRLYLESKRRQTQDVIIDLKQERSGEMMEEVTQHQLVEQVQSYIRKNLYEEITLIRLAEALFFNPSYLSRTYKQQAGHNISSYIAEQKILEVKKLLENPNLKINEIAEKLAFNTPSYFTSFFRRMTGMTPQEYREQLSQFLDR